MTNPSGITPTEFKVLVRPDPVEEVTKGGILLPDQKKDADKFATTDGTIVALSHLAFTYATDAEWDGHKPAPGQRCVFARYAGLRRKGVDGVEYLLINDKEIVAIVE